MPSVQTHYLIADEICSYLENKKFKFDKNAILWGAQGPDFLFASTKKEITELGREIHSRNAKKTIRYLIDYSYGLNHEIETSYVIGFLTHYLLDSICHPFIIFGSKEMCKTCDNMTERYAHNYIEVSLDTIMVRYIKSDLPTSIHLKNVAPKDLKVMSHLSLLYPLMVKSVFNIDINVDDIANTEEKYLKWLKQHNDKTGFKKDFLIRKEKKRNIEYGESVMYRSVTENDDYDFANIKEAQWEFENISSTETFFNLYEKAVDKAKIIIDKYINHEDISSDEFKFEFM